MHTILLEHSFSAGTFYRKKASKKETCARKKEHDFLKIIQTARKKWNKINNLNFIFRIYKKKVKIIALHAASVLETFLAAPYSLYNKPNDVAIALYHFQAPKKGGKLPPFFGYFVEHLQEDKLPLCICRRILFVTGDNFLDTGSQSC